MILCIDVGNSNLSAYLFKDKNLVLEFKVAINCLGTSDELGIFMLNIIQLNNINIKDITKVGISSVVPDSDNILEQALVKYIGKSPTFLKAGIKTGLAIKTQNPNEVGADLIAGGVAAKHLFPKQNVLIFDLGTATTASFLNKEGAFAGVSIAPGAGLMEQCLAKNTAKLISTNLCIPKEVMGKNTTNSIQSGIYYAQLGFILSIIEATAKEYNLPEKPIIIATGGFASLFSTAGVFNKIVPELVALGIKQILEIN